MKLWLKIKSSVLGVPRFRCGGFQKIGDKNFLVIAGFTWKPKAYPGHWGGVLMVFDPKDNRSHKPGVWSEVTPRFFVGLFKL